MLTNHNDNSCSEYDLVIIGGGCAGLSLAAAMCRLAAKPTHVPSTLIVEPRLRYTDDRSWCFWDAGVQPGQTVHETTKLVVKSWHAWEFSSGTVSHLQSSDSGWKYHYIPAIRFYDQVEKQIDRNKNITLLKGSRVTDVNLGDDHIEVIFESGPSDSIHETQKVVGRQIVDTRVPKSVDLGSALLKQVFFGFEVKLDSPHQFDDVARVMEDMRVDEDGFMFDYVLPLTRNSLLVEFTRFAEKPLSPDSLRSDALKSLRRVCRDSEFQIVREEAGVIPMGLNNPVASTDPRWIHIGLGAGAARPSTGYAFKRIQRWAEQCAEGIISEGKGRRFQPDSALLMWMDKVFLRTISGNPAIAPQLFMSLARDVAPDSLLRFLTDRPSTRDLLAVTLALPKLPLIRCALAELVAGMRTASRTQSWHEVR